MSDSGAGYRFRDRAAPLLAEIDAALDRGEIDDAGWHARVADILRPAYLAAPTPQSQSGFSGGPLAWEQARGLLAEGIDRSGTFLDVGCANGLLMETMVRWCAAKRIRIEPYGLDIVPELAALARSRLPYWSERIFVGNALTWTPPMRFDFVRTNLDYVPPRRRRDLVERLMRDFVAKDGRLIVGVYGNADPTGPGLDEIVRGWGYSVAGHVERRHRTRLNELQRVLWIDAAGVSKGM
jgi:SAM-dependent methyltransferase